MKPILVAFEVPFIGEVTLPAYLTMLMIGFLVAVNVARRQGERAGMDGNHIVDLGLLMLILGIVGARMLSVIADGQLMNFVYLCTEPTRVPAVDSQVLFCSDSIPCDYHYICDVPSGKCHPPQDCLAAFKFWQGGLTYYGGFLLAVPGGFWYARRKGLNVWQVADVTAPSIALGLFFGRLGCFLNGCCYGQQTDSWAGVGFPGHGHPVHPTQLYESAGALLLFLLLYGLISPRKRGHGTVFAWLLVLYGLIRFALEFYRADPRGSLGPLSTSQIISIPLILAGLGLLWWVHRRARAEAPPAPSQTADPD